MAKYHGESAILEKPAVQAHINKMVKFYGDIEYSDPTEKYREEIRILKVKIFNEIDALAKIQKEVQENSLTSSLDDEYQEHLENIVALSEYNAVLFRILDIEIELEKRKAAEANRADRERQQAEIAERERIEAEEEAERAAEEAAAFAKKVASTNDSLLAEIAKVANEEKEIKRKEKRFEDFKTKTLNMQYNKSQ